MTWGPGDTWSPPWGCWQCQQSQTQLSPIGRPHKIIGNCRWISSHVFSDNVSVYFRCYALAKKLVQLIFATGWNENWIPFSEKSFWCIPSGSGGVLLMIINDTGCHCAVCWPVSISINSPPPSIPSSFISTETKPRLPERSLLAPPSHLMTVMTLDGGVSVTNTHLSSLLDIKVSTFMSPFYKILEKSDQKEHILV